MSPAGVPPPDVFISYARANRPLAEQLAQGLSAAVVVVLWSAHSVRSSFVRDESSRALKTGKLLPVRIEDVELPLGFGQLHTLDLLDWDGDAGDDMFQTLLFEVRRRRQHRLVLARPATRRGRGAGRG